MINLVDHGLENDNKGFKFNPNTHEGFRQAVNNGQMRMALEYAVEIIRDQSDTIASLSNRIDALEASSQPTAKKASSRKASKATNKPKSKSKAKKEATADNE